MFDLQPLLDPRSVAIVGASRNHAKPGGLLLRNIVEGGYPGELYAVNPSVPDVNGVPAYPEIADVPGPVDLAFICLPREAVQPAMEQTLLAGARAVAIVTAGFGEADDWGRSEQAQLIEMGNTYGVPIIGPNTIGTVSMGGRLRGSFAELPVWVDGNVAVIAQTGIYAGAVMQTLGARGSPLGVRASVDIGNRANLTEVELLQHFLADPEIACVGCHLESSADPAGLVTAIAGRRPGQTVVLLLPALSTPAYEASRRHTGSDRWLTAPDVLAVQAVGGIVTGSSETFVSSMRAAASGNAGRGRRVGIVTGSGALGVMAAGEVVTAGLQPATLAPTTIDLVRDFFPPWQQLGNPIDLWVGSTETQRMMEVAVLALAQDPGVDQVIACPLALPDGGLDGLTTAVARLRQEQPDVGLHIVLEGIDVDRWSSELAGIGASVHHDTSSAVNTIAAFHA